MRHIQFHRPIQRAQNRSAARLPAVIGMLTVTFLISASGCQRTLPPELPYDAKVSDELREDFDQFSESG